MSDLPRSPATPPRDPVLDGLRGMACVLMIFAHTYTPPEGSLARQFFLLGGFAPAFFYAVAGGLAWEQARRKSVRDLLETYVSVFFFGITYNLLLTTLPRGEAVAATAPTAADAMNAALRAVASCDILQIVAMGVLVTAFAARNGRARRWELVLLAAVCFGLHLALSPRVPATFGTQFLFATGKLNGAIFPALPWIPVFLLGAVAIRQGVRANLASSAACILLLAACLALRRLNPALPGFHGVALLSFSKEFVSPPYLLLTAALMFAAFAMARLLPGMLALPPLLLFGRESLLFLYLHMGAIVLLRRAPLAASPLHWLIVFAAVALLSAVAARVRRETEPLLSARTVQLALALLALVLGALATPWALVFLASLAAGLSFSLHVRRAGPPSGHPHPLLRAAKLR